MKYIALLRGINVGKERRIEMKKLRSLFESLGFSNVSTYINSGNIIFESAESQIDISRIIELSLRNEHGFEIPTLVKTWEEIKKIADAIPDSWQNDSIQRSDVAFLFPEIDTKKTVDELPIKKEYSDICYIKGAIYWNIQRKDIYKSHLNKIIGHKLYQFMTIRNVNTVRYLANINENQKD